MNIGITGHQYRPSIDWLWVTKALRSEIAKVNEVNGVFCSLATGSDQIAAEVAIELGMQVVAVIPIDGYEKYFSEHDLGNYRRLRAQCKTVQLHLKGDPHRAFFEAGKFIVGKCETLVAVWDGEVAEGLGGTGDVVEYARRHVKTIIHVNPTTKTVKKLY